MEILGVDIGGSGVKGAPVNIETGELLAERYRLPTPDPSTPQAVIDTVGEIVKFFKWNGPIGCGFPAVVKNGIPHTAANVDKSWIGFNLQAGMEQLCGCDVRVLNDADAAGIAEMTFGAGKNHQKGVVMMITLGTGIGTAAFIDGVLIPNLELGHIEIDGVDAELTTSDAAREREDLPWNKWGKRVGRYLRKVEFLMRPDLFIVGGGVSKKFDKFAPFLEKVQTPVVPAEMRNEAGIVGAALAAAHFAEVKSLMTE